MNIKLYELSPTISPKFMHIFKVVSRVGFNRPDGTRAAPARRIVTFHREGAGSVAPQGQLQHLGHLHRRQEEASAVACFYVW